MKYVSLENGQYFLSDEREEDSTHLLIEIAEFEQIQSDLLEQQRQNENLLRIMRERANAKRNLRPKKENPGYMMLSSKEFTFRYRQHGDNQEQYCRKNVLQTCFDASLPLATVKAKIGDDLRTVMKKLGIKRAVLQYNTDDEVIKIMLSALADNENFAFAFTFIANFRSNFWEIEFFTTKEITVPEEMRPAQ